MELLQYPSVTLCPGRGMIGEPFGFIEKFLNMMDPKAPEVQKMFQFIPETIYNDR